MAIYLSIYLKKFVNGPKFVTPTRQIDPQPSGTLHDILQTILFRSNKFVLHIQPQKLLVELLSYLQLSTSDYIRLQIDKYYIKKGCLN